MTPPEIEGIALIMLVYQPFLRGHRWTRKTTPQIPIFPNEINELGELTGGVNVRRVFTPRVLLCEGTDLTLFLKAVSAGTIYLDPALKLLTTADGTFDLKKRNQFRVRHNSLGDVYHSTESVQLTL